VSITRACGGGPLSDLAVSDSGGPGSSGVQFALALILVAASSLSYKYGRRRPARRMFGCGAVVLLIAGALAAAGAIRYRTCVYTTSGASNCPSETLGIRDPF
jgi:hypothetical protein